MKPLNARLTRRNLVLGGVLAGGTVLTGSLARYGVGQEFEEHVAGVLGVPVEAASALTRRLRERVGDDLRYDARAAAFAAVTTFPGSEVTPARQREVAIRQFLEPMLADTGEQLTYLGLRPPVETSACSGLLQPG